MQYRAAVGLFNACSFKCCCNSITEVLSTLFQTVVLFMLFCLCQLCFIWSNDITPFSVEWCTYIFTGLISLACMIQLVLKTCHFHLTLSLDLIRDAVIQFTMYGLILNLLYSNYFNQLCILSGDVHENPGPSSNISICHLNVRGLSNDKILAIQHQLTSIYDIICLTETFLNQTSSQNLKLDGYHPIVRKDRNGHGGGVAVYVSQNYVLKRRIEFELPNSECIWLEIRSNNNKFILATCYRPPNENADFWERFQFMLDLVKQDRCNQTIIAGDLNADPHTLDGRRLINFSSVNNLTIHIHEPTRVTETTSTILDQFLSNIPDYVSRTNVLAPLLTNDHCTISMELKFRKLKAKTYKRHIWLYKQADFEGMNNAISNYDWDSCFLDDNIDQSCANWTTSYLNIARQFIPNKVVEIRPHDKPWFNSELRKLKRLKDKLHRKAKLSQNPNDWANFRSIRNQYTFKL